MSMHKIPLTDIEKDGLNTYKLPVNKPSQNSDCFRIGFAWANNHNEKNIEYKKLLEKCLKTLNNSNNENSELIKEITLFLK